MSTTTKTIGLFGYGTVGQGFYDFVTAENKDRIPTVVVKSATKQRNNPNVKFITNGTELLNNEVPSIIVEAINNEDDAFTIVSTALKNGKSVVSASKKLLANRLAELLQLEKENNATLLYEPTVAGSIPILRVLSDFYQQEEIYSIKGILNGTSNFILTQLHNNDVSYENVLLEAQAKGFAEADPTSDVGGYDALYKLVLLTLHGFGKVVKPNEVFNYGIQQITKQDIQLAKENNLKIKQVATVIKKGETLELSVVPTLIDANNELYQTDEEYNAVQITSATIGTQYYKGKGAGSRPTGSAVYADLKAIDRNYSYNYKTPTTASFSITTPVELLVRVQQGVKIDSLGIDFKLKQQLQNDLYYVVTNQQELFKAKTELQRTGTSLLFFDNESIKKKLVGTINEVTVQEFYSWKTRSDEFQLIDVREKWEYEFANIGGELIPLNELEHNLTTINKDKKVVVLCRSGKRSANAIELLQKKYNFNNLYNLKGGILAWAEEIDSTIEKY